MSKEYNSEFPNGYRNDVGSLFVNAPQTVNGKKVFDWQYIATLPSERVKYDILVHLKRKDSKSYFEATCQQIREFKISHTDIVELEKIVMQKMAENVDLNWNAGWEDWLQVEVSGSDSEYFKFHSFVMGSQLKIAVRSLKRGVCKKTGRVVTIGSNGYVQDFPSSRKFHGEIEKPAKMPGDGLSGSGLLDDFDFTDKEKKEISYVKDTPENREALAEISSRMIKLRSMMADFMSQDKVQESIVGVQKNQFLLTKPE